MNKYIRPLIVALTLFFATPALAVEFKGAAKVINFTGEVTINRAGVEMKPVKGLDLMVSDTVKTGKGRISFLLSDESMVSLTAESHFTINEFSRTGGRRKGSFSLAFGKVKSVVSRSVSSNSEFLVRTPTAVAGVRGTEFYTGYDPQTKKTDIAVLDGIVFVSGEGPKGMGPPVNVTANQKTSVGESQPPAPPVPIPKSELNELKKSFDIARTEEPKQETKQAKSDKEATDEGKEKEKGKEQEKSTPDTSEPPKLKTKSIDADLINLERLNNASNKIDAIKDTIPQQKDSTGIKVRW